ncbi:MAG: hypothetical protein KDA91_05930 [Planctomycetaceae bacterium]|nr:hypothetical protein [Planctomycetaceae bacterium]
MEYTYRQNIFHKSVTIRLDEQELAILDEHRTVVRSIPLTEVKSLFEYDGIKAQDPRHGTYRSRYCRIKFVNAKALTVRNGQYLRPNGKYSEYATNQEESFMILMLELKNRLAELRPQTRIYSGSYAVVAVCVFVAMFGFFMLMPLFSPDLMTSQPTLSMKIGIFVFFLAFGGLTAGWGVRKAYEYWPRSRPVFEDVLKLPRLLSQSDSVSNQPML